MENSTSKLADFLTTYAKEVLENAGVEVLRSANQQLREDNNLLRKQIETLHVHLSNSLRRESEQDGAIRDLEQKLATLEQTRNQTPDLRVGIYER